MVRVYVTDMGKVPKGVKLQRGRMGGMYYETTGAKLVTTKPQRQTTKLPTKPEEIQRTEQLLEAAVTGKTELTDDQHTQAREIYDQLAQIENASQYPQYQKMWDYLVKIFD